MRQYRLYVVDSDGSNLREIVPDDVSSIWAASWSPDGTELHFSAWDGAQYDLYKMEWLWPDPSAEKITDDAESDYLPDVSPDGRLIAFHRWDGSDMEIAITSTNPGGEITYLTSNGDDDYTPRWSPGGRYIAFTRDNGSPDFHDIYVYDMFSRDERKLTGGTDSDYFPDWTVDGQYILFSRSQDLYRTKPTGKPATEQLVQANWGQMVDSWGPSSDRWRVLIGADGTDWGGNDPPFGGSRDSAVVAFSPRELATALAFHTQGGPIAIRDCSPGRGAGAVVCEARGEAIDRLILDQGSGVETATWELDASTTSVILVFSPNDAQLTSVIALEAADTSSLSAAGGAAVGRQGQVLVVSGATMRVYDGAGRPLTGPGRASRVELDAQTGVFVSSS